MSSWAIGIVRSGHEIEVADDIVRDGRQAYCPRYIKRVRVKRWQRKPREEVEAAAYPGYIFVDESTIGNIEEFSVIPGFHLFLRYPDGRLKTIPATEIDAIRSLEGQGILSPTLVTELVRRFTGGDTVRVVEGVLVGYTGVVKSDVNGRTLAWFGQHKLPIEIASEFLEPVDAN